MAFGEWVTRWMISIREEITKYKGILEADVAMETERKFIRDLKSMLNAIWWKCNTHTNKVWNKKNKKKRRRKYIHKRGNVSVHRLYIECRKWRTRLLSCEGWTKAEESCLGWYAMTTAGPVRQRVWKDKIIKTHVAKETNIKVNKKRSCRKDE